MHKITQVFITRLNDTPHGRIWFVRGRVLRSYNYHHERVDALFSILPGREAVIYDFPGATVYAWEIKHE